MFGAVTTEPGHADLTKMKGNNGRYARFQLNRYVYPDNMDDFIQYCSWLERAKMFLRMERVQLYVEEKYGGRRPILRHYASMVWDRFGGFWTYRQINWARVSRLVFVCKGNICRSPYAETRAKGYGVEVVSIGLTAKSGTSANPDAIKNAEVRGINLGSHRAKRQEDICIGGGDLLVAMEPGQASVLQHIAKKEGVNSTGRCNTRLQSIRRRVKSQGLPGTLI